MASGAGPDISSSGSQKGKMDIKWERAIEDELASVNISLSLTSKMGSLLEAGATYYGAKHRSGPGVELKEEI